MIVALPKRPETEQFSPNADGMKSTYRSADVCHLRQIYLHIVDIYMGLI